MTAHRALFRGLTMAASAAAALARQHRQAGELHEYLNRSRQAAWLYEESRIARGDREALIDRAERVLFDAWHEASETEYLIRDLQGSLKRTALEAAREALAKMPVPVVGAPDWLEPMLYAVDRQHNTKSAA